MTAPVFVDTNVFVYARDARDAPKQRRAMAWLEFLWREQAGRTSAQVLSEYFVTVTRKLAQPMEPDAAWDDVRALFAWQPRAIDPEVLTCGVEVARRFRLSWWDSLVVAAAQLQSCPLLLSEDLQDGLVIGGVTVRSPFTIGVHEAPAPYRARRVVRGRGPREASSPA
ncbi:MAG: PIN domain-containing protein [Burkholderiaceae bacterium]